ncbi:hypothetical protein B9Z55_020528 [Caenorhabditis nigoni]|uniref:SHSP domain-containing protein n=1 Tax=Caenorhabditis nigoni TaxID=1611254 RepID=A0A2G5TNN7_9PELO|nr:hypothetical protein B9Z55_020528 [Caenorhabditis nigoni]
MSVYHYYRPTQRSLFNELMEDFGRIDRHLVPFCQGRTSSEVSFQNNLNLFSTFSSFIFNTDEKFAVNLNVSQFKPEDLKINLDGRTLTIQGEQEVKNDSGYSKKSFSRVIILPEDVDVAAVVSNLSEDGKLSIEAPKKEAIQGRSIPIQKQEALQQNSSQ